MPLVIVSVFNYEIMWKFKNIQGSILADSYKKGWELAVFRFERYSSQAKKN